MRVGVGGATLEMMSHSSARLAYAAAAMLLLAGCGRAAAPPSTDAPTPPATRPHGSPAARYLADVAAPLRAWTAASDAAAASLRAVAALPPGGGRQAAAGPVGALEAASAHAAGSVGAVDVPPPLRRAQRALLRAIGLTGRGSRAVLRGIGDWPLRPTGRRVRALRRAAADAHAWERGVAPGDGEVTIPGWVSHLAAASASLAHAARAGLAPRTLAPGTAGPAVARLQRRLAEVRDLPPGDVTRTYDDRTMQAVVAFQGWEGLPRDGIAGPATLGRLLGAEAPQPWSTAGRHIEIHKAQQVLLLVDAGAVVRAIHVSTAGPGHVTPDGTFAVYRKELMSWSVPFQVWMPYASYFVRGFALHEYPDVPPYPASHGCVRVPAGESIVVWDFAAIGTPVVIG